MNPIPEPIELQEAECNALGLYGLPEALPTASRDALGKAAALSAAPLEPQDPEH